MVFVLWYVAGQNNSADRGVRKKRDLFVLPATTNNTMEPGEALGVAAQVAVALAGFAGVVVVFRTDSVHEWSLMDKLRLRLLLANSVLPLAFCLFALFLLTMKPPPDAIWRWCSGFAAALLFPFGFYT